MLVSLLPASRIQWEHRGGAPVNAAHTLGGVRTEEPWAFVLDSKQIPSAPEEGTLFRGCLLYTHAWKDSSEREGRYASAHKKCRTWKTPMENCLPTSSTSLFSVFSYLFTFLLSFAPTRTWAPWEQGPSLLGLCSFPYCLKQHLADSRSSVNTSWANKSLTILLVLQDPAYPAFRGAIPDPWNWDVVFRHLGFHNTYPLSMALGVEPFVL